ncbi:hypothetical protein RD792_017690 [Penstemon davidsonii]|uniref:Aminotransferase-like plant mobile domain-containing protein n=1 Tax=Penstemon davidsonii TaxID=160366 RepID=A0ABR0DWF0_9LAMI|nr:hypothetical protein RD792_017690 [Penstemon davidsonii]
MSGLKLSDITKALFIAKEAIQLTRPSRNAIDGVSLKLKWLMDELVELPLNATLERVQQHARAIILAFIGGVVLPNKTGNKWRATKLLRDIPTHVLKVYRDQLDQLSDDHFVWRPYVLEELPEYCLHGMPQLWMSKVPLICFKKVEFIFPDPVLRQFGMLQEDMGYNHEYMMWYRRITRMFVGNSYPIPAQIDGGDEGAHTGYRGIGGGVEGLLQQLQRIDFLLGQVDHSCPQATESRNIIANTFTAYREHNRLEAEQFELPPLYYTAPHTQRPKERRRGRRGQESGPPAHPTAPSSSQTSPPPTQREFIPSSSQTCLPPTQHEFIPSSSQTCPPPTQREFIPPPCFTHAEYSTPNFATSQHESQFECVTQADTQTHIGTHTQGDNVQVGTQGDSMQVGTRGENLGSIERQTSIKIFRKSFSQRDKRAPNRYTPN